MPATVTDNKDLHRFEIRLDGELAGVANYREAGDVVTFTHTEVEDRFQGHGVAKELVGAALDSVRGRGESARPECPLVAEFIGEHPEYRSLVPEQERSRFGV
jgi:predicted GNAT family acetyltransferase